MRHSRPGSRRLTCFGSLVDPSRRLLQQPVKQRRLGQGDDRVVFHAEQRGGGAEGVLGVDHHDAPVAEFGLLGLQRRDVHRFGKGLVRDLQIGLQVVRVLQQMLGRPDRVEIAIPPGRLGHRPPGHGDGGPRDPAVALLPGLLLEELLPDRAGGGAGRIDRPRPYRTHQADEVGALLGQLQERAPIGSVVDVVRIRIVGIDLEPADLVEAHRGPIHRFPAQRRHQAFASGEHASSL